MKYSTIQVYSGYFHEGKRHGIGQYKNSRSQYYGPFKDDIKEGKGTIIYSDGTKFEGWL